MRSFLAIVLLTLGFILPATATETHAMPSEVAPSSNTNMNHNLSMVGGGLLGVLVASGAVGLISAGTMALSGSGIAEAMEAGANLSMPVALLSAVLGVVFAQDFVLQQITEYQNRQQGGAHAH